MQYLTNPSLKTPLLIKTKEDNILSIAQQINLFIAKTIIYSSTAKDTIDSKDDWLAIMSPERIKSYAKAPPVIHASKTYHAREISRQKRRQKFALNQNTLSLLDIAEIAYDVGTQYKALNCGAQAMMAYHLLQIQGISAACLHVEGIDHVYLGLESAQKIFAIMDPWAGRIIPLQTPEATRLSDLKYGFFGNRLLRTVSLTYTAAHGEMRVDEAITLTP